MIPFGIQDYYLHNWGAYQRQLDPEQHTASKETQKIKRKNLNFRIWIKRLARRTILFFKVRKISCYCY